MPALRFHHNYRSLRLTDDEAAYFGVRVWKKNGESDYLPWRGFMERKIASRLPKARPVKIDVEDYKVGNEWDKDEWIKLSDQQAVQGCYINGVVFAVVDGGIPRLVLRTDSK